MADMKKVVTEKRIAIRSDRSHEICFMKHEYGRKGEIDVLALSRVVLVFSKARAECSVVVLLLNMQFVFVKPAVVRQLPGRGLAVTDKIAAGDTRLVWP